MPTVEIDIAAIKHNIAYIKSKTNTKFCAVVKADAYGHGLVGTATRIEKDVDFFAVATYNEAVELAMAAIKKKILILGNDLCDALYPNNIIPVVTSVKDIEFLRGKAKEISIAVNTGMNRIGCLPEQLPHIIGKALEFGFKIHGIFTHLFNEHDLKNCYSQLNDFLYCTLPYRELINCFHVCASNCLVLPEIFHLDAVRAGLAMYGYGYDGVIPAMRVFADIVQINNVPTGAHIGYGDYTTDKPIKTATLRVGYGDGFRRIDGAAVSVNGTKCPIVGNICMDMCIADVTSVPCNVGDRAYILGDKMTMNDLTRQYNTISHEVLTMFGARFKRIYV